MLVFLYVSWRKEKEMEKEGKIKEEKKYILNFLGSQVCV